MPFPVPQVQPVRMSNTTVPDNIDNKLECVTNTTLCQVTLSFLLLFEGNLPLIFLSRGTLPSNVEDVNLPLETLTLTRQSRRIIGLHLGHQAVGMYFAAS